MDEVLRWDFDYAKAQEVARALLAATEPVEWEYRPALRHVTTSEWWTYSAFDTKEEVESWLLRNAAHVPIERQRIDRRRKAGEWEKVE